MSAAAIALLQGFRDYAASGKPFGYPAGSLQLIDQILAGNDPDVRGPMIRLPILHGEAWVHIDAIAFVTTDNDTGKTKVFERGDNNSCWTIDLTVLEVVSLIERADRRRA